MTRSELYSAAMLGNIRCWQKEREFITLVKQRMGLVAIVQLDNNIIHWRYVSTLKWFVFNCIILPVSVILPCYVVNHKSYSGELHCNIHYSNYVSWWLYVCI